MTRSEKTAALAAARFEEIKAHDRLIAAREAYTAASRLVSLAFAGLTPPAGTADVAAFEAAKVRVAEADTEEYAARKALGEAAAAYHTAAERRVAIENAEVIDG